MAKQMASWLLLVALAVCQPRCFTQSVFFQSLSTLSREVDGGIMPLGRDYLKRPVFGQDEYPWLYFPWLYLMETIVA